MDVNDYNVVVVPADKEPYSVEGLTLEQLRQILTDFYDTHTHVFPFAGRACHILKTNNDIYLELPDGEQWPIGARQAELDITGSMKCAKFSRKAEADNPASKFK